MTTSMNNQKKTDLKKYAVFAGMGLLFVGAMYMIFVPSAKSKEEQNRGMGLNTEVPEPFPSEIADDKRAAYEDEQARLIQQSRMKTLEDFASVVQVDNQLTMDDDVLFVDEKPKKKITAFKSDNSGGQASSPAKSTVDAYRDINRSLGSFYEQPTEDERVNQLSGEIEILKEQLENRHRGNSMEEQLALMEKSYQMAAKYLPQGMAGTMGTVAHKADPVLTNNSRNSEQTVVVSVAGAQENVVSALRQQISDAEFIETYSQQRNIGFFSPEGGDGSQVKNTIRACIHDDQTVSDGLEAQRNVRIRLIEPMSANGTIIPANTILTGQARIGERLDVTIISIEYMGRIYPVDIAVYDVYGQRGIAIPPSMEVNALKEVAANSGSSAGTSISFSQSAGQQIAADVGRGLVQGTSQYFAKKMSVVKIHLKAGHQVFLLPKEN